MTGDAKLLKISCLAAMFVGAAALVLGIVLAVGSLVDVDAWTTAAEGLVAAVLGVRTAILANVPSNTAKIRNKVGIGCIGAAAIVAFFFLGGQDVSVPQIVVALVLLAILAVAFMVARRIVREQLRR